MEVLGFEGTEETANFDPIITPILAANPDVIFFAGIYNQAGVFFKQARDAGYAGTFLGTDGMDASNLADLAGDALTRDGGMYYTTVAGPVSLYPAAATFATDFAAKYGAAPQAYAAQGYDAAGICLKAIENAATAAGGIPSRIAVAEAIRALTYAGITGEIAFDSIGDLPVANYYIVQVHATSSADWGTNEVVTTLSQASPGQ
jgi:ABC-type branched-subunit amino acid transport system substrate-binding protein